MARPEPAWVPPLREGVGASRVGVGVSHFPTLFDFLVARFPAIDNWVARLARGDVLDASGQPMSGDAPCLPGMQFWYWRDPPPEPHVPFDIDLLHQDQHLVVVDKPHFLATMPGGRHLRQTVLVRLKQLLGIDTLAPMHRLDRDTAGVLAFTVQPATRGAYQALLRERRVHKVYEAIAPWRADLALPLLCRSRLEQPPTASFMQMQVVKGEANAQTLIELIGQVNVPSSRFDGNSVEALALAHYRLTPHTGRRHQLRAQMNALGLPIVGDRIYPELLPDLAPGAEPDYSQPLQLLARELSFIDPIDGRQRSFLSRRRLQHAALVGRV